MAYVATTAENQRVDGMLDWRSLPVHGMAGVRHATGRGRAPRLPRGHKFTVMLGSEDARRRKSFQVGRAEAAHHPETDWRSRLRPV
jgi:hypothetical protein